MVQEKNLFSYTMIETTKNNISWLVKLQLPVNLFTFIISNTSNSGPVSLPVPENNQDFK